MNATETTTTLRSTQTNRIYEFTHHNRETRKIRMTTIALIDEYGDTQECSGSSVIVDDFMLDEPFMVPMYRTIGGGFISESAAVDLEIRQMERMNER